MAAPLDVSSAFQAIPPRKERLHKAFLELKKQKAVLAKGLAEWKEVDEHFVAIEKSLRQNYDGFLEKEKALEAKMKNTQTDLDKRDQAVSLKEQASLARVQEQKDAAVAAILEQKRKWSEERQRLGIGPSVPDVKVVTINVLETKQQPSKATSSSTAQAMDVDKAGVVKPTVDESGSAAKVEGASKGTNSKDASGKSKDAGTTSSKVVNPRPQLKSLCENMDGVGLRKFIAENRKDVISIRAEMPAALKSAIDPARLVLKALEGYHSSEQAPVNKKGPWITSTANRRACILLLEGLAEVLADTVSGVDRPVVPPNIKASAKEVAELWKSKMNVKEDPASGFSLDVQGFLQLLVTFGLASDYDTDELCKLVNSVARRKQTPALCRSLGLSSKIPDMVENLIKDGKQIEALSFANAFGLMEKFQPVPLLKAYLKEVRKSINSAAKNESNSSSQNDANTKELAALKAVLKCIEDYKLEAQYPPANLQKRVTELEKAKSDRKRTADAVKIQTKRPRINAGSSAATHNVPSATERPVYRPPERAQYGSVGVSSYSLAAQPSFDGRPQGGFVSSFSGGSRNPGSLSSSYLYSADGLGSPVYGTSGYTNPSSYSSYQFGTGLPPSSYQSYMQ